MSTSVCSKCDDLRVTVPITSTSSMTNVLTVISDNIADGTLVEAAYWPPGKLKIQRPSFTSIVSRQTYSSESGQRTRFSNCMAATPPTVTKK